MPLTHLPPPRPVRAIHVAEVEQATRALAEAALTYLRRLMWGLEYPRTEWHRGRGVRATTGAVAATQGPFLGSTGVTSAPFVTGSDTPGTAAVADKALLLASLVGTEQPVRSVQRFFDGVLLSVVPDGAPLPPPVQRPVEPETPATDDLDEENFAAYVRAWARWLAAFLEWIVDREWREHFADVTRFPTGTVTSVAVAQKLARVRIDPQGENAGQPTQVCGFGTRAWTAATLNGKHVRLGHNPSLGWFVDDWD
jgi:hypothetical protein